MVGDAVKVTELPAQIVEAEAATETAGVTIGFTVKSTVLDVILEHWASVFRTTA